MDTIKVVIENFGASPEYHMMLRAIGAFLISLVMIRIAGIRSLGRHSAFDRLTLLMLGAVMGRAIVTNQSFLGSVLAALVLMLLHRVMAWIAFRNSPTGKFIKGKAILLMKDGIKNRRNLAQGHISDEDIREAMRQTAQIDSLDKVKEIHLERSGEISIVKKEG